MRNLAFCICENKDTDQLRRDREADQRLCFRFMDGSFPLLLKSEISSLLPSSVVLHPSLCRTWSGNPEDRFLTTRLIKFWHIAFLKQALTFSVWGMSLHNECRNICSHIKILIVRTMFKYLKLPILITQGSQFFVCLFILL